MKNRYTTLFFVGMLSVLVLTNVALAENDDNNNQSKKEDDRNFGGMMNSFFKNDKDDDKDDDKNDESRRMPWGVVGVVTAVNGTTITVESKMMRPSNTSASTTYTVNAANATVIKNNATSSVSNIAVGDMVMAEGALNGTTLTATKIFSGSFGKGRDGKDDKGRDGDNHPMGSFEGNGQPVVGGKVTAITGSTLTIANKSNTTYTVDTANAFIQKNGATSTVSSVAVNDQVLVQGAVTGNSITASAVIDRGPAPAANSNSGKPGMGGLFGGLAHLFGRLFGF